MNKKYIAFGLMGFFAIALASAMVVDYLSNKAEVSVTVSSPFSFEVSSDGAEENWIGADDTGIAKLSLTDSEGKSVQGGESVTFFARDTNLANVDTIGDSSKIITCDRGVTCNDFISVIAQTTTRNNDGESSTGDEWDLIEIKHCTNLTDTSVAFNYGAIGNPLLVGQADTTEITATFQPNAIGDYIFTLQKLA